MGGWVAGWVAYCDYIAKLSWAELGKNQNYNENNEENKDSNPETIMHQIYNKQLNLTPEEEKSWMEGPITKLEMQEQVCFSVNNAKEV